jgi:phenylacetaldehyde dehydrogenase
VGESLAETIGSRLPDFRVVVQITPWNFPLLMAAWKLGPALAAHPDVDKVAFTSSTEVGKLILGAAAGNLKKVSLELGGKSPNIVCKDADVEACIPGVASAIFFNQGQVVVLVLACSSEKGIFDKVVEGVAADAKKIKVGPGMDPTTQLGPLVS